MKRLFTTTTRDFLVSAFLVAAILLGDVASLFYFVAKPEPVSAAQVVIDATAEGTGTSHLHASPQSVFISDLIGYKFYRDATGTNCKYSKTTDGGNSWGTPVTFDNQADCIAVAVWYDQWTPGDSGTLIHIATIDTGNDDIFYNALDTSGDTLATTSSTTTNPVNAQGGAFTAGGNYPAITKGTDGTIYVAMSDATDRYVLECSTTCHVSNNWTETGTTPLDLVDGDYNLLLPLTGDRIMVINRDVSAEDMRYKIWNNTSWSGAWTAIDGDARDNTTYDIAMAAQVSLTNNNIYLTYLADHTILGADDDIRVGVFNGTSWSTSTALLNAPVGLTGVALGLNQSNDDLYLAYTGTTTTAITSANVYWKMAENGSTTRFGPQQGPVNISTDSFWGVDINGTSDQRMFVSWFDDTDNAIHGDTIADIAPGVYVSASTSHVSNVFSSSTNRYIGGKFVIRETEGSRNVTGITINESGTVDAQTSLDNIKLLSEQDTSYPYNCDSETYAGSETQFGSTDTDGFSGADGDSSFTGSVAISTTSTMCVYVVADVGQTALNAQSINYLIADPTTSIIISGGGTILPTTTVAIASSTAVLNDDLTLTHFHWRLDNGSEAAASSATGGAEDTTYTGMVKGTSSRLRIEVSNEGASTTALTRFRLEYAVRDSTCEAIATWTDVGATGGDFDMFNTGNLTDGANTTNVANTNLGAVTDENTTFLVANTGVKDTSSQTAAVQLLTTNYIELEYAIRATSTLSDGTSYCFRVTDAGLPLDIYSNYPKARIAADVILNASGTQSATADIPSTDAYLGGQFVFQAQTAGTRDITSITITATGTVDFQNSLSNIELFYDLDTTAPYDCASESYSGVETQYGATDADGFSVLGRSTFTGSVVASTTRSVCVYPVLDVDSDVVDGATYDIEITDPQTDVVRSSGTISPSGAVQIEGITTFVTDISTLSHYHWRQNNGSETTASSATNGLEDMPLTSFQKGTTTRLRVEVSNEGSSTTAPMQYRLEYAQKISTCAAISSWTDVGAAGGDFDMSNSTGLTDEADSTDLPAPSFGAVTNEATTFVTPNGGVRDTTSQTGNITLLSDQFTELEYSIIASSTSSENATYCFRVTDAGTPLNVYTAYPEATIKIPNDFFVQRGVVTITTGTSTIVAGVDYIAPSASSSAFVRITNTQHTGAGTSAGTAAQNADDVTAYITNPGNIMNSISFLRQITAPAGNTRVAWEIIEYTGPAGGDNEFKVRQAQEVRYIAAQTTASTTATAQGVVNNNDVVVFITGAWNPNTVTTNYNTVLSTAAWNGTTSKAVFSRGEGADAVRLSFAVVEFTGANWNVQRVSHTYVATGTIETEPITAVNSLSRTFLHVQKTVGAGQQSHADFGHEVWLSSVGAVSFQIDPQAGASTTRTSVAWVIENTQTTGSVMDVTRSNGTQTGGTAPRVVMVSIGKTLSDVSNASIFTNNRSSGVTNTYPEPMMAVRLIATSTTDYEIWVSNTTDTRTYRTEVVEWPTAKRQISQNYYKIYVNEDDITLSDPWPAGANDLGENTAMTGADQPMTTSDVARIRMTLNVSGQSSMPSGLDAFKLQYGKRSTSCTAVTNWLDIGDSASTTAQWRGYNNPSVSDGAVLSTNPPTGGDLEISISDRAGTYEEENISAATPYLARSGEDVEFDWVVQDNSADIRSSYCFRMVESDDTELTTYNNYPILKTIGYGTESLNWRWYDDAQTETPVTPLALETVSPIDVDYNNSIALRVTLHEFNGANGVNAKFKLQFSESSVFATSTDVEGSTTCSNLSYWCYTPGGGADGSTITTKTLSDADTCVASVGRGCGTHTSSSTSASSYTQQATSSAEFSFTIRHVGARANRTYYFRAYDMVNDEAVAVGVGESYPSLTTKGSSVTFSVTGVATSTVIEGVTTDTGSTPTSIAYGTLPVDATRTAAYQLSVDANATEGYQILVYNPQELTSSGGSTIEPISASNTAPAAWTTACQVTAVGCFGYHVGDDTLSGNSARFAPNDTYAALETTPREVAYSSIPVTSDTTTVIYRVLARSLQPAGQYSTQLTYIIVPVF